MEQRKLGRSPLQVPALGLGLMSMSGVYGNADDAQSIALIHHALERGVTFLDSADMYGWGHNEELLGKALKAGATRRSSPPSSARRRTPRASRASTAARPTCRRPARRA